MSEGPETTTTTSGDSKNREKTVAELEQERILASQTQETQDSNTATHQAGTQQSTNTGTTASSNTGTQESLNTGATTNVGQTSNVGSQATQQQGTVGTQNTGQQVTSQDGTTAQTNIGATTGNTTTEGLAAAQPALAGILSQAQTLGVNNVNLNPTEMAALGGITQTAERNAGFAPQITDLANAQFAGGGAGAGVGEVNNAYDMAKNAYSTVLNGDPSGQSNPYLQSLLGTIQDNVRNDVGSRFAAAGRSFSGAHADALGKGMASGLADPLFQNYWKERDAQMGAAGALNNAAIGRSSALDSAAGNVNDIRAQGATTLQQGFNPYSTMLNAGGYEAQTPITRLGALGGLVTGIAGTGGTTQQAGTSVNTGLTDTSQRGLVNTSNTGLQTSQETGLTNTANAGASSNAGTSVNAGLLNTSNTGLVNTQQNGLVNTTQDGTTDTHQDATQNVNSTDNMTQEQKNLVKGSGSTSGTQVASTTTDPLQTAFGAAIGVGGMLLNPAAAGSGFATVGGSLLGH